MKRKYYIGKLYNPYWKHEIKKSKKEQNKLIEEQQYKLMKLLNPMR